MRWFRPQSRLVAVPAIVTLLIQLALTSVHVHAGDPPATFVGIAAANLAGPATTSIADDPAHEDAVPVHEHGDQDRAHGQCLVCANIHLAGFGQLPESPALDAPTLSKAGTRVLVHRDGVAPTVGVAFRSRAPPLA
jgi:hypothetical protein